METWKHGKCWSREQETKAVTVHPCFLGIPNYESLAMGSFLASRAATLAFNQKNRLGFETVTEVGVAMQFLLLCVCVCVCARATHEPYQQCFPQIVRLTAPEWGPMWAAEHFRDLVCVIATQLSVCLEHACMSNPAHWIDAIEEGP